MSKYVTTKQIKNTISTYEDDNPYDFMTVYERNNEPTPIGVLDIHGNEYMKLPDNKQIGFKLY